MKKCTWCGKTYPDGATECPIDQHPLEDFNPVSGEVVPSEGKDDIVFRNHVLIPSLIWLLVFFLVLAIFRGGVFFFALITAVFAAFDAAKYREDGTRILGISFKPVVVFAVCVFFFFGFGFIWYLFMRHRVLTTPLEPETGHAGEGDDSPPKPVTIPEPKFPWEH